MKKNNYNQAAVALALAFAGLIVTYPLRGNFWGGLLAAGFSAAVIGGCADWFAVTALFRRPLGLRTGKIIRTEIIPRNRERIFAALADMVQNELLSRDTLKKYLEAYDFTWLLTRYLNEHGGMEEVSGIIARVAGEIARKTDPQAAGRVIDGLVKENLGQIKISSRLGRFLEYSLDKGYPEGIIEFILEQFIKIVQQPQAGRVIFNLIKEALAVYEMGMDRRKFANVLMGLSPLKISQEVHGAIVQFLAKAKEDPEHPARTYLRDKARKLSSRLQKDPKLQEMVEGWKHQLSGEVSFTDLGAELAVSRGQAVLDLMAAQAEAQLKVFAAKVKEDSQLSSRLDTLVKGILLQWIDERHAYVGRMVKESLDKLTDSKLVELIEEKAGNDLQIIRINGTLVGGLTGMLIFLLTFWID